MTSQIGAGKVDGWRFGEGVDDAFARAAPCETSEGHAEQGLYSAPVLNADEFNRVAVPFSEISNRLQDVLDENGFAVVTGVVPTLEELLEFENDFKDDLLSLIDEEKIETAPQEVKAAHSNFLQEGPASFPLRTASGFSEAAGFNLEHCMPHGKFAWRARRHDRVRDIFGVLFSKEGRDLVTSLDAVFFTPTAQCAEKTNRISAHVDQNKWDVREGLGTNPVYQGVLYVWPSVPDGSSSTTVVWPGSHKKEWHELMKDETAKSIGKCGTHYTEIKNLRNKDISDMLTQGWHEHARRIIVPPGALVLWNSRTIHTGWKGGPRLAQPVCLEPKTRQSDLERYSKLRLAALGLPSTHWAANGMQHDMSLYSSGVFADKGSRAEFSELKGVQLPLRPCLNPEPLSETADLEELEKLTRVKYETLGIWKCPSRYEQLLRDSVKQEFKPYL